MADYDGSEGIGWPLNLGQRGSVSGGMAVRNRSDRTLVLDRVEGSAWSTAARTYRRVRDAVPTGIGRVFGYHVPAAAKPCQAPSSSHTRTSRS